MGYKKYDISINLTASDRSVLYALLFAKHSWEIFKESPIVGIGTGDFPNEYKKVNALNTPDSLDTVNPHNMYILVLTQLGILGLISRKENTRNNHSRNN